MTSETTGGSPLTTTSSDDLAVQTDSRSLGDLVGEMTTELGTLVRQEIKLARAELTEEARRASTLAQQTANEARDAMRQDLQIAQQEIKQELDKAKKGAVALAIAGVTALVALFLVAWTIAWAINQTTWEWVGFLITAVLFGIIAAVAAMSGRKQLQQLQPTPQRALDAVKRDAQDIRDRSRDRAQTINPKPDQTIETLRDDMKTMKGRT